MPYTFDDSEARKRWEKGNSPEVPAAGMRKYHNWRRAILDGKTPQHAAELAGDCHFERLNGGGGAYSIRLTQEHRVEFTIDGLAVRVTKIGGHYVR